VEEKIRKIEKKVKGDRFFINLVLIIMIAMASSTVINIIKYSLKNPESFEVKFVNDENFKGLYCLFIDGENFKIVDYNDYLSSVDENGNTNIKMCVIIQEIGTLIRTIIMSIIFYFAYLILDNIMEPFSNKNIKRFRFMAVLTMLLAILPAFFMIFIKSIYFSNINIKLSYNNFFILMMGILLGIISEIFKYGHELQEEIEQIA
jgi:ABC-type sugar transport system permease subunit